MPKGIREPNHRWRLRVGRAAGREQRDERPPLQLDVGGVAVQSDQRRVYIHLEATRDKVRTKIKVRTKNQPARKTAGPPSWLAFRL